MDKHFTKPTKYLIQTIIRTLPNKSITLVIIGTLALDKQNRLQLVFDTVYLTSSPVDFSLSTTRHNVIDCSHSHQRQNNHLYGATSESDRATTVTVRVCSLWRIIGVLPTTNRLNNLMTHFSVQLYYFMLVEAYSVTNYNLIILFNLCN